jgi:ornithine cyclodeaminase/alanine dehydrogenase-like protein (mu-crystallin family)
MLVLSHEDVEAALPMTDCIAAMAEAMKGLSRGDFFQPLRSMVRPQGGTNLMGFMPALRLRGVPLWSLKEVVVVPGNAARGLDPHQGAVLLHDGETGALIAAINASAITAIRTAAVTAVATQALARPGASVVAIIGSGHQARAHLRALRCILPNATVRIASRTRARAQALAEESGAMVADSTAAALDGADIVCTVTNAAQPILERHWIAPGCHINAVGSSVAAARELDGATMAAGALFVDRRESTLNESGDYRLALQEGAIAESHIRAELGEVLLGEHQGRTSSAEITIFKSLGLAIEDMVAAELAFHCAKRNGLGVEALW